MTIRTSYDLKCDCGETGHIHIAENGSPYSICYEDYSVFGFKGRVYSTDGPADWDEVFKHMQPRCMECGAVLTRANLK